MLSKTVSVASVLRLYLNDKETFREVCPRLKIYLTLWCELNSDLAYAIVAPRSRIKSTARRLAIWHFPLFFVFLPSTCLVVQNIRFAFKMLIMHQFVESF